MKTIRPLPVALCVVAFLAGVAPALGEGPFEFDLRWGEPRLRIGVEVQPMTPELRGYFEAPADRGVLVAAVEEAGPAAEAGLAVGDVIVSAAGTPVQRPRDLRRVVASAIPGEKLALEIVRDGESATRSVRPAVSERAALPWELGEFARRGRRELEHRIQALERRLRDLERLLKREFELRVGPQHQT